nr:MAG TPA: hypothetical protein [Bacteriophage sp.]
MSPFKKVLKSVQKVLTSSEIRITIALQSSEIKTSHHLVGIFFSQFVLYRISELKAIEKFGKG